MKERVYKKAKTEDEILDYLIAKHYPAKQPGRITAMAVTYKAFKGRNRTEITKLICEKVGKTYWSHTS